MIKIRRKMTSEQIEESRMYYYQKCQASLNSDGNITLRNYDCTEKDSDEIFILTKEETRALYQLFALLKNESSIPF